MCGICGKIDFEVHSEEKRGRIIQAMCTTLRHRGPDDEGVYTNSWMGFGHRRLSILDLSITGHQPMCSSDGRVVVVMNGEIYNHRSLRQELEGKGYAYRGTSDTETVLYGYLEWGTRVFAMLNGIFSIAVYDRNLERVVLVRDRFGVKPLYYYRDERQLIFSSEIKGILSTEEVTPQIHYAGLHEFLYYGYALGDRTMFRDIAKLMPGQILEVDKRGKCQTSYFWKPESAVLSSTSPSEQEAIQTVRTLLEEAVRKQLMSDVPVGVFLSGGIDSSAITAFASKHYHSALKTYSAAFDFDDGHNELPLARKVAQRFHTDHHELMIKGKDMAEIIEIMVRHHDEPFSDAANIPLYLLTRQVKDSCTVVLQGDGGDELFGGYPRYHITQNYHMYKYGLFGARTLYPLIPSAKIKEKVNRFGSVFREEKEGRFFAKLLTTESEEKTPLAVLNAPHRREAQRFSPFAYYEEVAERFVGLKERTQRLLWLDTQIILPNQFLEKVDKSTMANGVEVRVPFLDNTLSSYAMGLPAHLKVKGGTKKYLLKKALQGIVPDEVLYGPKKGFGVPYQNWLRGPLLEYMQGRIHSPYIAERELLDITYINRLVEEHRSGVANHGFILWKVLNLCIWLEEYKVQL